MFFISTQRGKPAVTFAVLLFLSLVGVLARIWPFLAYRRDTDDDPVVFGMDSSLWRFGSPLLIHWLLSEDVPDPDVMTEYPALLGCTKILKACNIPPSSLSSASLVLTAMFYVIQLFGVYHLARNFSLSSSRACVAAVLFALNPILIREDSNPTNVLFAMNNTLALLSWATFTHSSTSTSSFLTPLAALLVASTVTPMYPISIFILAIISAFSGSGSRSLVAARFAALCISVNIARLGMVQSSLALISLLSASVLVTIAVAVLFPSSLFLISTSFAWTLVVQWFGGGSLFDLLQENSSTLFSSSLLFQAPVLVLSVECTWQRALSSYKSQEIACCIKERAEMVAAAVFSLLWAPPVLLGVRGGTVSQFCHVMMVHSLPFICILGASRCSNLLGSLWKSKGTGQRVLLASLLVLTLSPYAFSAFYVSTHPNTVKPPLLRIARDWKSRAPVDMVDDVREAVNFLRHRVQSNEEVTSWESYSHAVSLLGAGSSALGSNPRFPLPTALQETAKAFTQEEAEAARTLRSMGVRYVVVSFGSMVRNKLWHDVTRWSDMKTVAGVPLNKTSALVRMAYQGFFLSKSPGNFHQINGFDPLIGMRIDMESSKPMLHFEQVYTSSHWMIRIFRVLSEDEDRDPLRQAQERYLNLIAQQTKKAKARQNVRDHDISYSDVPRESSDSRAYVRVTQDSAGNPQRRYYDANFNEISAEEFSIIQRTDQVKPEESDMHND